MIPNELAPSVAAALAAKGYTQLTSVQSAVLAPEAADRDLLVSAQTGSGKTVAFGLAIAPLLIAGDIPLAPAERPMALVVAPTRELALQVARELDWLYAEAGARIATCVGGMDFRTERRALERGAHIVVGTPGRLRDHIERGTLALEGLRAAVLDEADEMLDLGFREDLEFILGSAPETRRTLLFSATIPGAIARLARDYQRDALRIAAAGEARQHGDIAYHAHLVAPRDSEPAIFNLLMLHQARAAIVFCKTRANVNHLLARMANRGFRAVALSGELSQQERSHALQALRDGRADVCIATDVAARGIDLPGLDLVIHADLPTNAETLLHRSGRTGRAGAKGISALIVPRPEQGRAQRLLRTAQVQAEWADAPSADDVRAREDERLRNDPALLAEPGEEAALGAELLARHGPEALAAALVRLWRAARPVPEDLIAPVAAPGVRRDHSAFADAAWFALSIGQDRRAEPRWLLPQICAAGGISREAIGAIRVREAETYVQVIADEAARFGASCEIGEGLTMTRLAAAPDLETRAPLRRPPREPQPHRKGPRSADHPRTDPAEPRAPGAKPAGKFAGPRSSGKPAPHGKGKPGGFGGTGPRPARPGADGPKAARPRGKPAPR